MPPFFVPGDESCRLELLEEWLEGIVGGDGGDDRDDLDSASASTSASASARTTVPSADEPVAVTPDDDDDDDNDDSTAEVLAALAGVQNTPRYRSILEDCYFFLADFHTHAETTCNLQKIHSDDSYSGFWAVGPINLDGGILLAADLLVSDGFREPLVPCADSCYVRDIGDDGNSNGGSSDCQDAAADGLLRNHLRDITVLRSDPHHDDDDNNDLPWLAENHGHDHGRDDDHPQANLCRLQWLETDAAYQRLRLCAAESVVSRATIAARAAADDGASPLDSPEVLSASTAAAACASSRDAQAVCSAEAAGGFCAPRAQPVSGEIISFPVGDDDGFWSTTEGDGDGHDHDHSGGGSFHAAATGHAAALGLSAVVWTVLSG